MLGVGVTYSLPLTNQTYETADTLPSSSSSSSSLLSQTSILLEEQRELEEFEEEQYEFASETCSFTVIGSDLADTLNNIIPCIGKYSNCTRSLKEELPEEREITTYEKEIEHITGNKIKSENIEKTISKTTSNNEEHFSNKSNLAAINMSEHSRNSERREHRQERQRQRRAQEHRRNSTSRGSSHSQSSSDKLMTENKEWEDCDSNVSDGDDDDDDNNMCNEHVVEKTFSDKPKDIMSANSKENAHIYGNNNVNGEVKETLVRNTANNFSNINKECTSTENYTFEEIKDGCHALSRHRSQLSATAHISYVPTHHAETVASSSNKSIATETQLESEINNNNNSNEEMSNNHRHNVEERVMYNSRGALSCTPPPESLQTTVPTKPFTFEHVNNKVNTRNNNIINSEYSNDNNNNVNIGNTYTRMYTVVEHKREGECDENKHKPLQQQEPQWNSMPQEEEEEEEQEKQQRQHYLECGQNEKESAMQFEKKRAAEEEVNHKIANRVYEESDQEVEETLLEEEEEEEQEKEMHGKEKCCDKSEGIHTPECTQRIIHHHKRTSNNINKVNSGKQVVPSLQLEMLVEAPSSSSSSPPLIRDMKYDKTIPLTDAHFAGVAITRFMTRMCKANISEPVPSSDFHSHRLPPMSVKNYMERIVRHCNCSGEALLCGLVLLLKYSFYSNHPINIYNAHRLLLTSTVLGIKMRDEVYYSNVYYARIGGITPKEMNKLEVLFLSKLGWDVSVEAKHYGELRELLTVFVDTPVDDILESFANTHFIREISNVHNRRQESEASKEFEENNLTQEESPSTLSCKLCTECIDRLQSHVAELVATKSVSSTTLESVPVQTEGSTNINVKGTTESNQKKLEEEEKEELEKEQERKEQLEMELEEYNSDDYDGFVQNAKTALSAVGAAAHSNKYSNRISNSNTNNSSNSNYRQRVRKWNETANISLAQLIKCFRCHTWQEEVIPWLSRFQEETFAYHEEKANRERADWAMEEQKWESYRAAEYAAALEASTRSSVSLSRWTSPQSLHKSTQLSHISSVNQTAHAPLSYLEFQQQQQQQHFFYAAHGHELYPSVNHFGGGNSSISAYCLNGNRPISYHTHLVNGQTLTYEASPTSLSASTSYHSYLQQQQSQQQSQQQQQHECSSGGVGWSYMNNLSDGMLIHAQGVNYSSIHADPNYFPGNSSSSSNNNNNSHPMFGTLGVSEENYQAQIADQYDRFKNADGRASPMTINGSMSTARYTNFRHNQRTSTPTSNNTNSNSNTKQQSNYNHSGDVAASNGGNNNLHANNHNNAAASNRKQTHYFTGTAWRHGNQRVAVPTGLRSPYAQGKVYSHNEFNTNSTALIHNNNSNHHHHHNESTGFLTRAMDKESTSAHVTTNCNLSPQSLPPRPTFQARAVTPGTGINVHAEPYYFSKKSSSKLTSTENKNGANQSAVFVRIDKEGNPETNKDVGQAQPSTMTINATHTSQNDIIINNNNYNTCTATDNGMPQNHNEFPAIPVYTYSANNNNDSTNNSTQAPQQEVEQRSAHPSHSTLAQVDTRERSNDSSANGETASKADVRIGKKRPKPAHYQDYY